MMRSFDMTLKIGTAALMVGFALTLAGCDDPMSSTIKSVQDAQTEKYKVDKQYQLDKEKLDNQAKQENDRETDQRRKDQMQLELDMAKQQSAAATARASQTLQSYGGAPGPVTVGEKTKDTTKPAVNEGAALGGGPTSPTTSTGSSRPTTK